MQAKKKGILNPETSHNGSQCLDHPNPEPSSASGGNRALPVGVDVFPCRGWKRSSENEDDENFAGFCDSVSAEEEADKLHNWRDSGVRWVRKSWSCITGRSISGGGGITNGVTVLLIMLTTVVRGRIPPTGTSGDVTIAPDVRITVILNTSGEVETVLKTFTDFRSRRSATYW